MGNFCSRKPVEADLSNNGKRVEQRINPTTPPDAILSLTRDNNATGIRSLVGLRCSPSHTNRMGQSALHMGAMWGNVEAVKVLIELQANVNLQNRMGGQRPLHAAAMGKGPMEKRRECALLLMQGKADPSMPDTSGRLAQDCTFEEELRVAFGAVPLLLHRAVSGRNLADFNTAVAQVTRGEIGGLTLHSYDPEGKTALHVAVLAGWAEGVQTLLANGADVCASDCLCRTPLHFAVCSGDFRIVKMLLQKRAQVDVHDRNPEKDGRFSSRSFKESEEYRTPLHYASEFGCVPSMRLLLNAHADPNATESNLQTPLHLCLAAREDVDGLSKGSGVLISGDARQKFNGFLGSIIGTSRVTGEPPMEKWPVLVEDAESSGVWLKTGNLNSSFDEALCLLLEAKADVNMGNQLHGESRTVLHQAVSSGDTSLVKIVLQVRADVHRQDTKLGFSALHMAARAKKLDIVRLLIEAQANTRQLTGGGKTAAELASVNGGSAELLHLLYRPGWLSTCFTSLVSCLMPSLSGRSSAVSQTGHSRSAKQKYVAQPTPAPAPPTKGLVALMPEQRAQLYID